MGSAFRRWSRSRWKTPKLSTPRGRSGPAEVVACYAVPASFQVHVFAPDLASFSEFAMKALLRMPGVKGTRSSFIMQAVKSDLAWAPQAPASVRK